MATWAVSRHRVGHHAQTVADSGCKRGVLRIDRRVGPFPDEPRRDRHGTRPATRRPWLLRPAGASDDANVLDRDFPLRTFLLLRPAHFPHPGHPMPLQAAVVQVHSAVDQHIQVGPFDEHQIDQIPDELEQQPRRGVVLDRPKPAVRERLAVAVFKAKLEGQHPFPDAAKVAERRALLLIGTGVRGGTGPVRSRRQPCRPPFPSAINRSMLSPAMGNLLL